MAKIIYLSPSNHGTGANKGIEKGCYEDGHTRPIAEVAAKHLEYNGFKAVIAKKSTSVVDRCAESDRIGADIHMAIHTNASSDKNVRYLMLMFYDDTKEYREMFDAMDDLIEAVYPGQKDAVFAVRDDLIEINTPKAKSIYLELGFHTNKTDSKFMHDEETVGKAIAQGICKIFGVKFKDYTADKKPATKKPATAVAKPAKEEHEAGDKLYLVKADMYASSTSKTVSSRVTGTFYLWDNKVLNGRCRITNNKSRVGLSGQVTGYIDEDVVLKAKVDPAAKKCYAGRLPTLPEKGYLTNGDTGTQVGRLQEFLNWYGNYGLKVDKDFGPLTEVAVEDFQNNEGLVADGEFGKKSLAKAKKVKK